MARDCKHLPITFLAALPVGQSVELLRQAMRATRYELTDKGRREVGGDPLRLALRAVDGAVRETHQ